MYFCPRSYAKVSELFRKIQTHHLSSSEYHSQPRAYSRKIMLLAINATQFEQQQKEEDAKMIAQIHQENKLLKSKVRQAIKQIDRQQLEIKYLQNQLGLTHTPKKAQLPHCQTSFTCPLCAEKVAGTKQEQERHYRAHIEEAVSKKNNQLLDILVEQQKALLSRSQPLSLSQPIKQFSDKEKQLDQLIKQSQSLIQSLTLSKEEIDNRGLQLSDHLLRVQRYEFERRSSQQMLQLQQHLHRPVTLQKKQQQEEGLCYLQPDSKGLIHLADKRIQKPYIQTFQAQSKDQKQKPILLDEVLITPDSSFACSRQSSLRCCREEDFKFDQSRVQTFTGYESQCNSNSKKSKRGDVSSSVDFTISNDSNSQILLRRLDYSRPSLLIQQDQ